MTHRIALIPAYEPDAKLLTLLAEARNAGFSCLIVNDGSGMAYESIFRDASQFGTVLSYSQNHGKGYALKLGLSYILENEDLPCTIVTMDADGQHTVADAQRVCAAAEAAPDALVLGCRQFDKKQVPLRSRFGNRITLGVYRLATGRKLHDTQTGLRAFDSRHIPYLLQRSGDRYEYEMNVLLDWARDGMDIREVPIKTVYLDGNRSSHFNTVLDSFRIYREILKFSASSFVCFLVDYGLYSLFLYLTAALPSETGLLVSNISARVLSSVLNYSINRKLVFQSKANKVKSAAQYFLLAAGILAGNSLVLSLLVQGLGMSRLLSKILTELLFFGISYTVQHFVIFRTAKKKAAKERISSGDKAVSSLASGTARN
jgi:putative flippase GtrA